jgi:tetratricopeptide (TPR) repeat protein
VFGAAFAVRLLALAAFSHSPDFVPNGDDMKFYNDWALRILHGQFTDGHAFYGLPGYAWCLAGIYKLCGVSPIPVGILQAAFDAATATLIFFIAARAFARRSGENVSTQNETASVIGLGAALGWIAFIPAQAFSMILMPTSWLVAAFWGCVWWLMNARTGSVWRPWLAMGAAIGVVSVLVATILFLLPLALVAIVLRVAPAQPLAARAARSLVAAVILFAGVFAGCAPAWTHNYFIAHEPVLLSAHSGLNLYIGNNPLATGYPKIPPGLSASQEGLLRDSITLAEKEEGRTLTRAEVSRHWSTKANTWIREHRAEWWRLLATKLGNFWNAFQYDDLSIIALLQQQGVLSTIGLRFGLVAALALPGLIFGAWRFPGARWITAAVLLHMAAILPVFVTERYRLCAVPGLLIFASYGLWQLSRWLVDFRIGAAVSWCAALAGAAWIVSLPRADIGLWSLDHYNTGIRALKTGDFEQAQRSLETAFVYVQDNAEINFALGTLWQRKGDPARATTFYKHTLELDSGHAGALNNLGLIALDRQDFAQAEGLFLASIAREPDDAKRWFLLARARLGKGDRAGAREAVQHALTLRPQQPDFEALRAQLDAP